jgi:hypothetical protein
MHHRQTASRPCHGGSIPLLIFIRQGVPPLMAILVDIEPATSPMNHLHAAAPLLMALGPLWRAGGAGKWTTFFPVLTLNGVATLL